MTGTSAAARIAARYDDRLAGIPGLGLPRAPQWAEPVWHLYVVRTGRRAELMKALEKAGIGSLIHYPIPPHLQAAYADLGLAKGAFPLAEDARRHRAQPADGAAHDAPAGGRGRCRHPPRAVVARVSARGRSDSSSPNCRCSRRLGSTAPRSRRSSDKRRHDDKA